MFDEGYYGNRNSAVRFRIESVDDGQTEQYLKGEGLVGEKFDKVLRIAQHGFSSHAPEGSHALGIAAGHKRDALFMLGGEHPDHRPKNIGKGNTAIYNADGSIMKLVGKNVTLDAGGDVTYTVKSITFKCGGVTLKLDGSGLSIEGGTVKHNGKNIGADHKHTNSGGSGLSGEPA